jgi:hypothetical protein
LGSDERRTGVRLSSVSVALGIVALAVLAGCGGGSAKSTDGGRDLGLNVTIAQACADLAQAECSERMTCSGGNSITRQFGTMENCIAREMLSCTNGLNAPQTGNSPLMVEGCAGEFAGYSCADFFNNNPPLDCVVFGPRPTGAACAFNGQCMSGHCAEIKNAACGTCQPPPAPGASCDGTSCDHDQACLQATMTCATYRAMDSPCDANHPCGYGMTCVGADATTSTPGDCLAAGETAGTACGGSMAGCDGTNGLFCGGTSGAKACMAITYVAAGEACGDLSTTAHAECVAGGCYTSTGPATSGQTGTCKSDAADGTACDTVLGPGCMTPARCVLTGADGGTSGTCEIPLGATCG